MNSNEKDGREAAKAYFDSQAYSSLTNDIIASDAAKLFLPPVVESMNQISTPMPKARVEWIKGFENMISEIKNLGESND